MGDRIRELAETCIEGIINDLTDRRGLKNSWDDIDADIKSEIKQIWAEIILRNFEDYA